MGTSNLETRLLMIRHMIANPDDVPGRLVYADHLEEFGVIAWPEFIRGSNGLFGRFSGLTFVRRYSSKLFKPTSLKVLYSS
jgi:uncharacterized protein (TIGR02996 family)